MAGYSGFQNPTAIFSLLRSTPSATRKASLPAVYRVQKDRERLERPQRPLSVRLQLRGRQIHQLAGDGSGRHPKGLSRLEDSLGILLGRHATEDLLQQFLEERPRGAQLGIGLEVTSPCSTCRNRGRVTLTFWSPR
jgi:hypothetical protein